MAETTSRGGPPRWARAGATRVASAFYSFNPAMVAEHVPAAWEVASPDDVLAARLRGVDRAYRALFGDVLDGPELSRAADLARRAAEAVHVEGRPLAAANAELPWPDARTWCCGRPRRCCASTAATATSRRC